MLCTLREFEKRVDFLLSVVRSTESVQTVDVKYNGSYFTDVKIVSHI
jgi:hypothetical protein